MICQNGTVGISDTLWGKIVSIKDIEDEAQENTTAWRWSTEQCHFVLEIYCYRLIPFHSVQNNIYSWREEVLNQSLNFVKYMNIVYQI